MCYSEPSVSLVSDGVSSGGRGADEAAGRLRGQSGERSLHGPAAAEGQRAAEINHQRTANIQHQPTYPLYNLCVREYFLNKACKEVLCHVSW